jgi:hypothetical protein
MVPRKTAIWCITEYVSHPWLTRSLTRPMKITQQPDQATEYLNRWHTAADPLTDILQLLNDPLHLAVYLGFERVLPWLDSSPALGRENTASEPALGKQQRDVLQLDALGFRVKEIHHWHEDCIQHCEDNKGLPSNVVWRRQLRRKCAMAATYQMQWA